MSEMLKSENKIRKFIEQLFLNAYKSKLGVQEIELAVNNIHVLLFVNNYHDFEKDISKLTNGYRCF